jgi:serine acetyltransferase
MKESISNLFFLKKDLQRCTEILWLRRLYLIIPLIYVKTWPVVAYRICRFLLLLPEFLSRFTSPVRLAIRWISQLLTKSEISEYAEIGPGLYIAHLGPVVVGKHVKAGNNLFLRQNVTLGGNGRDFGHPILGDDVTLGANCVVIGPVNIGSRSVIGAMSLVNKSFGEDSVLVGVPAINIRDGH